MQYFETIIIGAGPAGLSAAKTLAENNKQVLVLEKNDIIGQKICAGGLTQKDIKYFNIPISICDKSFNSAKITVYKKTFDLKQEQPYIYTIEREKLGAYLANEATKAGAKILLNFKVTAISSNTITLKDNSQYQFKYLIGADGANSLVRKYLKIPTEKLATTMQVKTPKIFKNFELILDTKLFGPHYAWIFPHTTHTRFGTATDKKYYSIAKLKSNFLNWLNNYYVQEKKIESYPINYDYRGLQFKNFFLVGEAGGFTNGLTGEGIYNALVSGQEAAQKIIDPTHQFGPKLIRVLEQKNFCEQIVNLYKFKPLLNILYHCIPYFTQSRKLHQRVINYFSL